MTASVNGDEPASRPGGTPVALPARPLSERFAARSTGCGTAAGTVHDPDKVLTFEEEEAELAEIRRRFLIAAAVTAAALGLMVTT